MGLPGSPLSPGLGPPLGEPDCVPDGEGDPEGEPDWDPDCEGDGEPEPLCEDDGEPDCGLGDAEAGGGLPVPSAGGGGLCGGWLRKIRIAMSTARAASSIISSQDTRMVRQPARS